MSRLEAWALIIFISVTGSMAAMDYHERERENYQLDKEYKQAVIDLANKMKENEK